MSPTIPVHPIRTPQYATLTYSDGDTRIWRLDHLDPAQHVDVLAAIEHLDAATPERQRIEPMTPIDRAAAYVGVTLHPAQRRTAEALHLLRPTIDYPARPIARPAPRTAPEGEGDWTLSADLTTGDDL